MNILLRLFMYLAVLGFCASVVAHVAGHMGVARPFGFDPWPLHIGIFIVWLPTVLVVRRLSDGFPQKDVWKATLRGCPPWMRTALYVIVGYVILNFIGFALSETKAAGEANALRGFSGHWLLFYFAAFATLYSAIHVADDDTVRRCKNGHLLEAVDKYCSQCGIRVRSAIE